MKKIICLLMLHLSINAMGQNGEKSHLDNALEKFDFIEQQVVEGSDTITYYLKNYDSKKPSKLFVFIQGTDANPLFSYSTEGTNVNYYRWFVDDYQHIDSLSTFAIVPKPGMDGIYRDDDISIPPEYYQKNYKEYRVRQINQTIAHIVDTHMEQPDQVIVYGHSEGAAIAAAAAVENDDITHLGFWSGNVLNNFYEFSLFNRIESLQGELSDSTAHNNILRIIDWYQSVLDNPESTELDHFGFTNKRWSSYETPPLQELLTLDIPIYAMFATEDQSTPIETAYLLPIQFMQHRKTNLSFEVCIGCDHSYMDTQGAPKISHWDEVFSNFVDWADSH